VAIANWFATLLGRQSPDSLHEFLSRFARYETHVTAYISLTANPWPPFLGKPNSYPVDVEFAPPAPQNRWKTGFRIILVVPAYLVSGALGNALSVVALFGWFTGLFLGRMPQGLRNLGVFALRYQAQLNAYVWLLTDVYPFSGPSLESASAPTPASETV